MILSEGNGVQFRIVPTDENGSDVADAAITINASVSVVPEPPIESIRLVDTGNDGAVISGYEVLSQDHIIFLDELPLNTAIEVMTREPESFARTRIIYGTDANDGGTNTALGNDWDGSDGFLFPVSFVEGGPSLLRVRSYDLLNNLIEQLEYEVYVVSSVGSISIFDESSIVSGQNWQTTAFAGADGDTVIAPDNTGFSMNWSVSASEGAGYYEFEFVIVKNDGGPARASLDFYVNPTGGSAPDGVLATTLDELTTRSMIVWLDAGQNSIELRNTDGAQAPLIDTMSIRKTKSAHYFDQWRGEYPQVSSRVVTGAISEDGGLVSDGLEFAFGGALDNATDDMSLMPIHAHTLGSDEPYVDVTYLRQIHASQRGIAYHVEYTQHLGGAWSMAGVTEVGPREPVSDEIERVTVRVPVDSQAQLFTRVRVVFE